MVTRGFSVSKTLVFRSFIILIKVQILILLAILLTYGRRQWGAEGGRAPSWVFIHGIDKVERGLIVLFFGLVFSIAPPGNFSAYTEVGLSLCFK